MAVKNLGTSKNPLYGYDFRENGVRYRRTSKAWTNQEAERSEAKIRARVSDGQSDCKGKKRTLESFVDEIYLPWAEVNKRSVRIDRSRVKPILQAFGKKKLLEITVFAVEKFKQDRKNTPIVYSRKANTQQNTKPRSVASVNRELCLLRKILTVAVMKKELRENPCREVNY